MDASHKGKIHITEKYWITNSWIIYPLVARARGQGEGNTLEATLNYQSTHSFKKQTLPSNPSSQIRKILAVLASYIPHI